MIKDCIVKEDIEDILNEPLPWDELEGKTFLVTGASGFIGSYIAKTLLALKNVYVIALVRNEKRAKTRFLEHINNPNLEIVVQDVCDDLQINKKIDFIVHAASQASPKFYGKDPVGTLKANTIGTYNLLEYAKKHDISKFMFLSSCEVYGKIDKNVKQIDETYTGAFDPADIRSCYGESKRMGENMCVCYSHQFDVHTNIIRPAHTYGPGLSLDDGRVFCDFVKNALQGEDIQLNSDGQSTRKFLYITDFIRGFFRVFFYGKDKEAYNITANVETTIEELAKIILTLAPQKNLKIKYCENISSSGYIKSPSTGANFCSDKIKKLGWTPKLSIKEGFDRMIRFYKDNNS